MIMNHSWHTPFCYTLNKVKVYIFMIFIIYKSKDPVICDASYKNKKPKEGEESFMNVRLQSCLNIF